MNTPAIRGSGIPSRAGLSGQVCEAPYGKPRVADYRHRLVISQTGGWMARCSGRPAAWAGSRGARRSGSAALHERPG